MRLREGVDALPLHRQSFAALAARAQRLRDERQTLRADRPRLTRRVAVVGGFTTQFVTRILDVFLFELGIDAEFYESPYGAMVENILNPESELYRFAPDLTLLLVHQGNLERVPELLQSSAEVDAMAIEEAERWASLWEVLGRTLRTRIVQSNFELPAARPLGNAEGAAAFGRVAFVRAVNARLRERCAGRAQWFDLEYLTARFGLDQAMAPKSHYLTKQPFSFDFLVPYCHALASHVALACGLAKKCVVLDLDGTLWGGTLAEDGVAGLVLGPDSAEGEAFHAFQHYLKALRARGVLLAVCSKNDEADAKRAFATHPHMRLALDDIACFVANWEDKATNIAAIAEALHIGRDALVFVDDRAEERHLVRHAFPEITVVEMPEDPADFVRTLDEGSYFEIAEVTEEATRRTETLVEDRKRTHDLGRFENYDAYLRSLDLRADIRSIGEGTLQRCAELTLRSNQWNLRTVRHSEADLRAFLARGDNAGFCVSLQDRYGSYGIISVVLLEGRSDAMFIDTWLMSCRVLKKGVERLVFNEIVARALARGARRLRGEYLSTPKNGMVADLLASFGFEKVGVGDSVTWELSLEQALPRYDHFIAVRAEAGP